MSANPQASILIVDDLPANVRLIEAVLAPDGYLLRTAGGGSEALRLIAVDPPDLVLLDVMMPGVNGLDVCRAIKETSRTRLTPVVLVTTVGDAASRVRGIEAGADDFVNKPINGLELRSRVRSLLRIRHYTDDLDSAESVVVSLALAIEARDGATAGHCERLARYAVMLGRTLGLDEDTLTALHRGGFLHDLGKIGIPDAVLLKPGRLTSHEYDLMKQHTVIGDHLCGLSHLLRDVQPIVRHHHERLNGSGYPDGLRGSAIPVVAQVMAVVDVFDALTTPRSYKAALPIARAADELLNDVRGGRLGRDIVAAFLDHVAPTDENQHRP
jgi:putative two-component system response regulator